MKAEFRKYETHKGSNEKDYLCSQGLWHDYSYQVGEDEQILVENCILCGHQVRFNKVAGRIDNIRFGETHMRYFLQHTHPFYEQFYGKYKELGLKDAKKEMAELKREVVSDARSWDRMQIGINRT